VTTAGLWGTRATGACARLGLRSRRAKNRQLFLHDITSAFRAAHFLSLGKQKVLKIMMAVATPVFKYRHKVLANVRSSDLSPFYPCNSSALGALRFGFFRLDRLPRRIIPGNRFERRYFQPVAAEADQMLTIIR
jgi:hypothetical protein